MSQKDNIAPILLSILLLSVCCATSASAGNSTRNIQAVRTAVSPKIDGFLTEDEWKMAVPSEGFLQFDPIEGADPTERTSVKVLYDDNALYVGVICYDSDPEGIVRQLSRRDRTVQADRFSVIIDTYHDHKTAFLFSGSVSGVQSDGVLSNDGLVYDVQWDAVWEFDAQVFPGGWWGEFRIPYSALRFAKQDGEYEWGINFRRYIARKKETDEWVMVRRSEVAPGTISSVSKMGHVTGITDISPPLHLELLPYLVSKMSYIAQPQPFSVNKEFDVKVGLDAKYGLTNNFTLDMAINPDFGQVEVDQAILNLTVFETFYPEKRPLFLEAGQIFSFGNMFDNRQLLLFYSRRIGRRPTLGTGPDPGYHYTESPQITSILGALKLTGRTEDGLTVGALTAVTNKEEAIEEDIRGNQKGPIVVEPRASYNVLRIKQDVLGNSSLGLMATGSFKDRYNPSLSGGFDWNLRLAEGAYAIDGYIAGSQRLDPNGDPLSGTTGRIGIGKVQDEHWLGFSFYDFSTRNFSINDLGYYSQPREHGGYSEFGYKETHALAPLLMYSVSVEYDYRWNWDAIKTVSQFEVTPGFTFRNFWNLTLDYLREFQAYDDENRILIGLYHRPSANNYTLSVTTDSRQAIFCTLTGGYRNSSKDARQWSSGIQVTLRPNTWMEFTPGFFYAQVRKEEAWPVYFFTVHSLDLFGDRDIDQFNFSLRGTLTFTRSISFQFFTQLFLAKGQYVNFKELAGADRLVPYAYNKNTSPSPDFNEKVVNANLVFRWEFRPGSAVYLVWTQERYGDNGIYGRNFSENFADALRLPMDNVILVKLSYWWSH